VTELVDLSLAEAAEEVRARRVSSAELVEATLQRIAATEPIVHAYARVMANEAHASAEQLDKEASAGLFRGPLHGVPVAVKDICYTAGGLTEGGSRVMAGFVPEYDATVVKRLVEAGAVVIGIRGYRNGHRRLDPRPSEYQRNSRSEANFWTRESLWGYAACRVAGPRRANDAHG
jgi:amidase